MAPNPKSQHTVSRLHLQHFAGPAPSGQVWTYDTVTAKRWSAIPKETCVQTHFYSVEREDGSMDTRLEKFLSEVESRAAPVYEGLLEGHLPQDPQARIDFSQFLALMHTRTTAMRRIAGKLIGRTAQIHNYAYARNSSAFEELVCRMEVEGGEKTTPLMKEKIRQAMLDPTAYSVAVSEERTLIALNASDRLTPILDKMKWSLVVAKHGYFITSDNPLVRQSDRKTFHPIYGDHGFLNKTAEITFPLSPELLLLLSWDKSLCDLGVAKQSQVQRANVVRAAQSDRYLFAHINDKRIAKLAAAYKDSRPDITTQGFGPKEFAPTSVARRSIMRKQR